MNAPKIIGLVTHLGKPQAAELTHRLVAGFRERGVTLLLESETAALVGEPEGVPTAELGSRVEMLVVLGGDGSLLRAVHAMGRALCPVFGINLGSLGFLTCVNSSASDEAVEAICTGNFVLSHRSVIEVEVEREGQIVAHDRGLNDAVISRGKLSLIKLDTAIDGGLLTQYNADGLIVSTPTGSTAYSISAGGPVILPDSGVFVVTPICPHVLTNRSVVVSDASEITVRPVGIEEGGAALAVDGLEPEQIQPGDLVRIRKSADTLPLVMLPHLSFCEVLRQKLKWSGSVI